MKLRNKFKLNIDLPTSSQSDIAFLLIIFFIITAVFFERTGIIFKLPSHSGKTMKLTPEEFIKVELYNDFLKINNNQINYSEFYNLFENIKKSTKRNVAIIYFSDDLKYDKFINVFQNIKKCWDMKVSIKPMEKNEIL